MPQTTKKENGDREEIEQKRRGKGAGRKGSEEGRQGGWGWNHTCPDLRSPALYSATMRLAGDKGLVSLSAIVLSPPILVTHRKHQPLHPTRDGCKPQ